MVFHVHGDAGSQKPKPRKGKGRTSELASFRGARSTGTPPRGGIRRPLFLARLLCLCGPAAFVTNDANRPPLPPFLQNLYYKKRTRQARPVFYPKAHTWLLIFARLATATATATSTAVTGHGRLGHALMSMPAVRKMIPRSRAKTEERHNCGDEVGCLKPLAVIGQ